MNKTLHINEEIHMELKKYCKKNGFQLNRLVELIIDKYLKNNVYNDYIKKS